LFFTLKTSVNVAAAVAQAAGRADALTRGVGTASPFLKLSQCEYEVAGHALVRLLVHSVQRRWQLALDQLAQPFV
jgi:hypothetical protein